MARPSLKDSLMAALNKGSHIETAEKIARGLPPIPDEEPSAPPEEDNIELKIEAEKIDEHKKPSKVVSDKKSTEVKDIEKDNGGTSDGQTVRQFDGQTDKRSNGLTVKQSEGQTVKRFDRHTVAPFDSHGQFTSSQSIPQTVPQTIPFDVLNLSYNQASILEFLISKPNGLTNYAEINASTNITMPSARDAIARLVSRGFMAKPQTYRSATYQGMSFVLNKSLCDIFISTGGLARDRYQTLRQTVQQSDSQTIPPFDGQTDISSSLPTKPTTKPHQTLRPFDGNSIIPSEVDNIRPSDAFVLNGPEMGYWLDAGLQERQTLVWCNEFDVEPDHLRMQLSWARWDLVENRKEDSVQNTINWLYGVLRRTGGCYPRPDNYLSPDERRLRDIEAETKRREEAREKIRQAEVDLEFQRILDNPEGKEYQDLLKKIPNEYSEGKGKIFETFLKKAFLENIGFE